MLGSFNPGMSQGPRALDWLARVERSSASPRAAVRKQTNVFEIDVRSALPAVATPTLVIHNRDNPYVRVGHAHYLVDNITNARYVELSGADHTPFISPEVDGIDLIGEFLAGTKHADSNGRRLMTVAFTDIVDSTKRAAALGDARWRSLLEVHESVARGPRRARC